MAITPRVEKIRQNYVNTKPHISYERAWSYTKSFKRTEGQPHILRVAQAFNDTCNEISVNIWEGELVVGTSGEFRKCAILTPEFGWLRLVKTRYAREKLIEYFEPRYHSSAS